MKSPTAILLFSRSAAAEAVAKPLYSSIAKNKKAVTCLVQHSLKLASTAGLPWYTSDETTQKDVDFGSNLASAIQSLFLKGHYKVIVIGNDCPGLTPVCLQKAILALNNNDWVLGPTPHGGLYLIGVTASAFNSKNFAAINWQTTKVFSELTTLIGQTDKSFSLLEGLSDANTHADLLVYRGNIIRPVSLINFLFHLLADNLYPYKFNIYLRLIAGVGLSSHSHRGPPSFI